MHILRPEHFDFRWSPDKNRLDRDAVCSQVKGPAVIVRLARSALIQAFTGSGYHLHSHRLEKG